MLKQIGRAYYLLKVITIKEFLQILLSHFFFKDLTRLNPSLRRLMIFSIACFDNNIEIKKHSKELLMVCWLENNEEMYFYLRKYSRDLLIFNQFFIDKKSFQYLDKNDLNLLKQSKYIIDAGANIGFSVLYFLIYFPNAKVICIEPEESNFNLLLKNLELNKINSR